MRERKMRYLITGGAGFVGSHLAERLLHQGHSVTIIDDLCTGSIYNIASLKNRPGFEYIIDTIFNRPLLAELVDACDAVFHLAASVGVKLIVESPVRTIQTNVNGTEAILDCANKKKKKVLIASTSEVYGKASKIPFSESDDLVMGPTFKGRWSYACSKAIDEFLALAYWKERQVPVIIIRLFNTVGPRQTGRYGMVVPRFVAQALAGEPMTVFGDGKQTRTFTHVLDAVGAIVQLVETPRAVGEIFNIGGAEEISIEGLAHFTKDLLGSPSPIIYVPYEQTYEEGFEDMRRRVPDVRKLRDLCGYHPRRTLKDIILDVAVYQQGRLRGGSTLPAYIGSESRWGNICSSFAVRCSFRVCSHPACAIWRSRLGRWIGRVAERSILFPSLDWVE
jgi:UDP-glucose 4-epimerase